MLNERQRAAKEEAAAHFRGPSASAARGRTTDYYSSNVIGWGIGRRVVDGRIISGESTVHIYVRELLPDQHIPEQFGTLPTAVFEAGKFVAYQDAGRYRPAPSGVSVGHPADGSGTLGCLVEKAGNHCILSNNHVLANSNTAEPGDRVLQPGPADGGTSPDDEIATLEPYQEIDFTGAPNYIDAAIALVGDCNQGVVLPEIREIGIPQIAPRNAALNQTVRKRGRTTGDTVGVVVDISADFPVNYGNRSAEFRNQILITGVDHYYFSRPGDSGSLIVDEKTRAPVALLFASGEVEGRPATLANPIDLVRQRYGVTIVGEGVNA